MKTTLFKKLVKLISLILTIAFVLTFILNYLYIENKFYSNIEKDMYHVTNDIVEHLDDDIHHSEEKFFYLVNSNQLNHYNLNEDQSTINDLLDKFKKEFPIVRIIDAKTQKTIIKYDDIFTLQNEYKVFEDELMDIKRLENNPNKIFLSDIKYSEELKKSVVVFSYLKTNYFEENTAIVYSLFILDDLFHDMNNNYDFRLLDLNDKILASTINEEINTKHITTSQLSLKKIDELTINGKKDFYFLRDDDYGKILMSIHKTKLLDEVFEQLKMTLLIFVLVFIFSMFITFIYSKKITRPIKDLLLQVEEYKKGNFSTKIQINTNDEIEQLSNSFEELGKNLHKNKQELLAINQGLKEKVKLEVEEKLKVSQLAMKAKDQFLASMSHEIRTPLNAILGFIEILKEDEKIPEKIKYLETIDKSSKSLLGIINDILDFNKIENQMLTTELIAFNPKEEFKSVKKLFDFKASSNGITLVKEFKNLPKKLLGDPLRIKQVLNNLLSNAIKFTSSGKKIQVLISYKDEHLCVSVKDEGIGISQKYQNNIFIPFTQEDTSTTRKYGGTGLGLSISHKLINLMGGELKVKSAIGEGSEFYFSIPLKETGMKLEEEKETSLLNNFDAHVLLAEDNPSNQMFMKILLKKLNLTFDIANDGVEAVSMYKKKNYDAILMDENMPNMSGSDATVKIIEYEKENTLEHTPIISLTANALKGDRERLISVGMDDYLSKPLKLIELSKMLAKYLKNQ